MSNPEQLLEMASALKARLTRIRRDIHAHPELGFNENRTARCVAEMLRAADVEVRTGVGKTGVVGLLRVKGARRTVALRADMDALPLQEANTVSYRSRNAGVMHACGHDGHTAMLLGAAFMPRRMRKELPGNVKFLFQPAKEIVSGAPLMVKDGALASPKVDMIFAAHVSADAPVRRHRPARRPGQRPARTNSTSSSPAEADRPATRTARATRWSRPTRSTSNSPASAAWPMPFQPCVISICSFESGVSYNVIPHSVEVRGTLRTFQPKMRARVMERMERVVRQTAAAHSVEGRVFWDISCPVLVNAAAAVGIVKAAAAALGRRVVKDKMTMGSEDFSFYLERVPGAFFSVGTRRGRKVRGHHSNRFDFDERILPKGAVMLAQCAQTFFGSEVRGDMQWPSGRWRSCWRSSSPASSPVLCRFEKGKASAAGDSEVSKPSTAPEYVRDGSGLRGSDQSRGSATSVADSTGKILPLPGNNMRIRCRCIFARRLPLKSRRWGHFGQRSAGEKRRILLRHGNPATGERQ